MWTSALKMESASSPATSITAYQSEQRLVNAAIRT